MLEHQDLKSVICHWLELSRHRGADAHSFYDYLLAPDDAGLDWRGVLAAIYDRRDFLQIILCESERRRLGTKRQFFVDFIHDEIELCAANKVTLLGLRGSAFPDNLAVIPGAPKALYVQGSIKALQSRSLGMVGARKGEASALALACQLAQRAAAAGWIIVSGGAIGCDVAAHVGALRSRQVNATVMVQAGGLGTLYPRCNQYAFDQILEYQGAIVSEKPIMLRPQPFDFPIRNRIIAGLSRVVVLLQAGEKSGACITINYAADYGRHVYVYHGPDRDIRFQRNRKLISEGAEVVEDIDSFLNAIERESILGEW